MSIHTHTSMFRICMLHMMSSEVFRVDLLVRGGTVGRAHTHALTCGSEKTSRMLLIGPTGTPEPSNRLSQSAVVSCRNLRIDERRQYSAKVSAANSESGAFGFKV